MVDHGILDPRKNFGWQKVLSKNNTILVEIYLFAKNPALFDNLAINISWEARKFLTTQIISLQISYLLQKSRIIEDPKLSKRIYSGWNLGSKKGGNYFQVCIMEGENKILITFHYWVEYLKSLKSNSFAVYSFNENKMENELEDIIV